MKYTGITITKVPVQTFPHDVVKELHDGDPAVRVAVEQLGVHSGCEEFSGGKRGEEFLLLIKMYLFDPDDIM